MLLIFYFIAASMIIATLAIVLMPMVRRGRLAGRPRWLFVLSLVLAFVLPLSAIGLYGLVGTPAAVQASARQADATSKLSVEQAIDKLKQHLAESPGDLRGWLLLGRIYTRTGQADEARAAWAGALKIKPDNADILVAWVEADSMARPDHRIQGLARQRLQQAVQLDPKNQRGLWLLGVSDYQADQFSEAISHWRQLQALLPPNSDVAAAVSRQIAMAKARSEGKTQAEAEALSSAGGSTGPAHAASAPAPARITVRVKLAPALQARVRPDDTLFVYAHAAKGSPMPLAIRRLKASDLPATVTLTDGMGMAPGHELSSARQVIVTARLSHSGQASPQAGDLQGQSASLTTDRPEQVSVIIDKPVHPR